MNGKEKCEILKNIRRDIAKANDIPIDIPECKHQGDCLGTCPRCEAEMKMLENKLAERRRRGFKIAVAGISAGLVALSTASCDIIDEISNRINGQELMGDMIVEHSDGIMMPPDTEEIIEGDITVDTDEDTDELIQGAMPVPGELVDTEYVLEGDIAYPDDMADTTGEE